MLALRPHRLINFNAYDAPRCNEICSAGNMDITFLKLHDNNIIKYTIIHLTI